MKQARFFDLPLGTRFSYAQFPDHVWVILDHSGCGRIARWDGVNTDRTTQSICLFAESESECRSETVIVREDPDFLETKPQGLIY